MKKLILIDASALIYRFFHALPPLTTPDGSPIQGIYGLSNVLLKVLREERPDYIAAALDRPEPTFRKEQFEAYKIQRPPAPDALVSQLKMLPAVFGNFGIAAFAVPGYEADDLIGTLAETYKKNSDLKIVILSGDLDVLQLVDGELVVGEIIKTGVSNTEIYGETEVKERYGLAPDLLPDYKGLVGDSSDNIPGVKGIGPKTASELLKEFGTLKGIFENLEIIKEKVAEKLRGKKEEAVLYRKLATIERHVPMEAPPLSALEVGPLKKDLLADYFNSLGFSSLVKRLE